jgi:arylsulfatase A-like enzyme
MKYSKIILSAIPFSVLTLNSIANQKQADNLSAKPNILIIHTDQLSKWALSAYGGKEIKTPNIDLLAKTGVKFNNFYTNSPVCSPSRGCFITGLYPHHNGVMKNDDAIDSSKPTFASILLEKGYATGYSGKWHLAGVNDRVWAPSHNMGFEDNKYMWEVGHFKSLTEAGNGKVKPTFTPGDSKSYTTDFLADRTIDFVKTHLKNPFCYMVSFPDPHTPFTVRAPYDKMVDPQSVTLPVDFLGESSESHYFFQNHSDFKGMSESEKEKTIRGWKAAYLGEVKCIDDNVGKIIAFLKETGIYENTVVILTTDHGEMMGEHRSKHKSCPFDAAMRIPFIMSWPAKLPAKKQVNEIVSTVDFAPTLLSLLEVKTNCRFDGNDASALLLGKQRGSWENVAFIQHSNVIEWAAIVDKRYTLCFMKNDTIGLLLDRKLNVNESKNYINEPSHASVRKKLMERHLAYCRKYNNPFSNWDNK